MIVPVSVYCGVSHPNPIKIPPNETTTPVHTIAIIRPPYFGTNESCRPIMAAHHHHVSADGAYSTSHSGQQRCITCQREKALCQQQYTTRKRWRSTYLLELADEGFSMCGMDDGTRSNPENSNIHRIEVDIFDVTDERDLKPTSDASLEDRAISPRLVLLPFAPVGISQSHYNIAYQSLLFSRHVFSREQREVVYPSCCWPKPPCVPFPSIAHSSLEQQQEHYRVCHGDHYNNNNYYYE